MDSASGFFPGMFSGALSIVMQASIVFGPKSQEKGEGGGAKFSEGDTPCGRKPGFRQYYVISKFCE